MKPGKCGNNLGENKVGEEKEEDNYHPKLFPWLVQMYKYNEMLITDSKHKHGSNIILILTLKHYCLGAFLAAQRAQVITYL